MRIFLAGAAGAIGRQLVPMLIAAGHQVVGTTRDPRRADWLREVGAEPAIVDAYDAAALTGAVRAAVPDAVIHQLTDLADGFGRAQLLANRRLREVGTQNLIDAMITAGVARLVAQSGAWLYEPGAAPRTEDDPLRDPEKVPDDPVLPGVLALERLTLSTPGITGTVLRYGFLYGPGTANATRDAIESGPTVHVADAARAALLAVERGLSGVFNVVDDGGAVSNRRAREKLGWAPLDARTRR